MTKLTHTSKLERSARWIGYAIVLFGISTLGLLDALIFKEHSWVGWCAVSFFSPGILLCLFQIIKPTPVTKHQEQFVVKRSSWTAISYLLICSGWLIGGLLLVVHRPETAWISFAFSYICAFGILLSLWQFFDPRPLLVINDQGFYDRTLGVGLIPWSAINSAQIDSVQGTDVINLDLKDREALMSKRSVWQKLDSRINQFVGFELLHLGIVQMDAMYIDEALDFILARCTTQREHDSIAALSELQAQL